MNLNIIPAVRVAILLTFASAFLLSCQREPVPAQEFVQFGELVDVTLCLNVASSSPTRSFIDDEDISCIKNLWVVQYSGAGADARLVGSPAYLTDLTAVGDQLQLNLSLVATSGESTVFFIANTFDKGLSIPHTLSEMVSMSRSIKRQADLLSSDGTDHHLIFSAWCTPAEIISGTVISANLSRNAAKVTLHVVNKSCAEAEKVTVNSVSLSSVPDVSFYFPTFRNQETIPVVNQFGTIDYPSSPWSGSGNQATEEAFCDFVFYVPVNKRGIVANDFPAAKPFYAPHQATYATVECSVLSEGVQAPVNYVFYLGANLVNDFNLESNRSYTYDIEIKNRGTNEADARICDFGCTPVDYTLEQYERANCYILNPPSVDDYWREFRIPTDRVNTFWGLTSNDYENNPDNCLPSGAQWRAEIIWSDFNFDNSNFRFSGGGSTLSGESSDPITVEVKKGAKGNAVVGIRKKIGDQYSDCLWSWHLWITDYSPGDVDKFGGHALAGVYDYTVAGGKVHRLEGEMWTSDTGIYRNSFIMDRALGCPDNKYLEQSKMLYYQFGRKDPLKYSFTRKNRTDPAIVETEDCPTKSIIYSIAHPDVFINSTNTEKYWTKGNKYAKDWNILWKDPGATAVNHKKSIFDPCPGGWKIPEKGAFDACTKASFIWNSDSNVFIYKETQLFPRSEMIRISGDYWIYGGYWTSSTNVTNWYGNVFQCWHISSGDGVGPSYYAQAGGIAVRCVKE